MGLRGFGDRDVAKELHGRIHASPQIHCLAPAVSTKPEKS
jgi:hypothetical protein